MKKRFLCLCLSIILLLSLGLVACGDEPDGGGGGNDDAVLLNSDYVEAYDAVNQTATEKIFGAIDTNGATQVSASLIDYDTPEETSDRGYYAVGAFVYLLRNLYADDDYQQTDDTVAWSASFTMSFDGESATMSESYYMRSFRNENGILCNDMLGVNPESNVINMLTIDVDYDFDTNTLKGFDFKVYMEQNSSVVHVSHYAYDGTNVSILNASVLGDDYNSVVTNAKLRYNDFSQTFSSVGDFVDYSTQYANAMLTQARIAYPDVEIELVNP